MEYTFKYEINAVDESFYTEVEFKLEITEKMDRRLKDSYISNKYNYLEDDPEIYDIYEMILEEVMSIVEMDMDGNFIASDELEYVNFSYPEEYNSMTKEELKMV